MKSLRPILALSTLLVAGIANAADVQLNCTSYSKEYDFKIAIGTRSARVDVIRAEPIGTDYRLEAGQSIKLARESTGVGSGEWMHFEGNVQGEQTLDLNVNSAQLAGDNVTLFLSISLTYSSTSAVDHQVECTK